MRVLSNIPVTIERTDPNIGTCAAKSVRELLPLINSPARFVTVPTNIPVMLPAKPNIPDPKDKILLAADFVASPRSSTKVEVSAISSEKSSTTFVPFSLASLYFS